MTMSLEKFREHAAILRTPGRRGMPRYPDAMRRFAITYAQSSGVGLGKAAERLGISDVTLRAWTRSAKRTGALLPVVVEDEFEPVSPPASSPSTSATLTLRTYVLGRRRPAKLITLMRERGRSPLRS
jgi:transposase-like protein